MKYAVIATNGRIIRVEDQVPSPPWSYVEITNSQADEIAQNIEIQYIVDGELYTVTEYSNKGAFDRNPTAYKLELRKIIASQRYRQETSGMLYNGVRIKTDRVTQSILGNARQMAKEDSNFTIDWKVNDTTFVTLTASQIIQLANAMAQHVQAAFTKERTLNEAITAATTYSDIKTIEW